MFQHIKLNGDLGSVFIAQYFGKYLTRCPWPRIKYVTLLVYIAQLFNTVRKKNKERYSRKSRTKRVIKKSKQNLVVKKSNKRCVQ